MASIDAKPVQSETKPGSTPADTQKSLADSKPMPTQNQASGLDTQKAPATQGVQPNTQGTPQSGQPADQNKTTPEVKKDADTTEIAKTITETKKSSSPITLPTNYWDIHAFTGEGDEIIIVSDRIWVRKTQTTIWKSMLLVEYFGKDFPLEKEIEEKQKVEDELATNQYERTKSKVMDELRKFFRPELINRFDEVIIFEPLKYKHMMKIAELQMKGIRKLMEDQNMGFAWTESAKKELVRSGFDPIYGARPLKRTIQKLIENPISTLIIEKKVDESDMILVDFDGEKFIFNVEHVSFVKEEKGKKIMKKFTCNQNHQFETEVIKGATVICPKEPKDIVKEITEEKKDGILTPDANKDQQSTKSAVQKPPQGGGQSMNQAAQNNNQQSRGPQNAPQQNPTKQQSQQGNGQQSWNTNGNGNSNQQNGNGGKGNTYVMPNRVNGPQNPQNTQQNTSQPSPLNQAPAQSQNSGMPITPQTPPISPLPTDTNSGQQMQPVRN